MPPRKRRKPAPADPATQPQKAIDIQASATVDHAEGSQVTGAVVNAPDAQSIQIGDRVAGDKVLGDLVFGDKNVYQITPPTPIDPVAAAAHLAALPLDSIPDLAALPPGSRMPLARNPLFVGREDDLKQLADALQGGSTAAIGQIAAATGLGGIGKTNLATEFVHRYGQYFAGGVFWLSFADAAAVPTEVAACGVGLDLPGFADLTLDDQMARVRHLWQQAIPRLLVFDNCEDETLLDRWRPTTGGCRVLITSRRAEWDVVLGVTALALDVLPRSESIALLRRFRRDLPPDDCHLDAIAAELGDLPLALHLAGSFLKRYQADLMPADYLAELQSGAVLEHESLQGVDLHLSPTSHKIHVGRTFALSYERLRQDDPVDAIAIALLARAACFAPGEAIPRGLLLATIEVPNKAVQRRASKAIRRLEELGLLSSGVGGALTIHRLLAVFAQAMAQDVEAQPAAEQAMIESASALNTAGDPRPLSALRAHLRYLTDRAYTREDERAASLCSNLGYHLRLGGDLAGARPYAERALAIYRQVQGEEHPDTALSLNNLGALLQVQGDLVGARSYYEQALAIWRRVRGEEHLDTAGSLSNLGVLLQAQGDLGGAQPYLKQALTIYKQVRGEEHRDTARALNNLGVLLRDMGNPVAARPYLEQALAIYKQMLGEEHPDTIQSLHNLGVLLFSLGDLMGARPYLEQALMIRQHVLGEEHPDTIQSLNNLGALLQSQGDLMGARLYLEQALAICKYVLGDKHPDTAQSLNNLGILLRDMGDLVEARLYLEQALVICKQVLGEQHPYVAGSLNNLGLLLQGIGNLVGAREYFEQALAIRRQVLGEEHPDTATSLNNLGSLLQAQGNLVEARSYFEQAMAICKQVLGEAHPDMASIQINLGSLLFSLGDLRGAQSYFEQALVIRQATLGSEHPDMALSLWWLGMVLAQSGNRESARENLSRAVRIYRQALGEAHPTTQRCQGVLNTLDTPAQTPAQRIAEIRQRAEAAIERALAKGNAEERAALTEKLTVTADAYASGDAAERALAAQLRALLGRLISGDADRDRT